jgi:hypothetical protein
VGVAAPPAVALGKHQHVRAERREVLAAQRAPVGGRLAILGGADLPPAGVCASARYCRSVEHRDQRIVAETDRHRISGILHLPRDGYRSRLTDYLNASERAFLALTDVEITSLEGGESQRKPFLALALSHIVLVMPAESE